MGTFQAKKERLFFFKERKTPPELVNLLNLKKIKTKIDAIFWVFKAAPMGN
jgi:hypothetical protein